MKVAIDEKVHSLTKRPSPKLTNHSQLPTSVTFEEEEEKLWKEKKPNELQRLSPPQKRSLDKPKRPATITRAKSAPTTLSQHADEALTNLAEDCMKRGDYSTAISMYQSILKEQEATYGKGHYTVGDCLHKIGECCLRSSQLDRALSCFEEAYSVKVSAFGSYHVSVGASLEKIGESLLRLNKVNDAHDAFRNSLRVKQKVLGLEHGSVADLQSQLGWIYFHTGELMASQAAFEDALIVYKLQASKARQKAHWLLASAEAISNIGSVQLKRAMYGPASKSFSEALMIQRELLGGHHPIMIPIMDNLGYALSKNQMLVAAVESYEEMLHAQLTFHKIYSTECLETLKKLVTLHKKRKDLDAALDITEEAIRLQQITLADNNPVVLEQTKAMLEKLRNLKR
eukprot:CAMPEP_0116578228 /NCGR_PEP_ID=MMETSP0397-20121206/21584_1 /TAXON_ID=216820 /ORGANISM="Cyclophora tenuis, Strain ECT3854" /LENGTH=398 /DNA_ID=CAMNT_0004107583 /DNA_START=1 /DNA_END=1197 /DNA_ORIENTATION=+